MKKSSRDERRTSKRDKNPKCRHKWTSNSISENVLRLSFDNLSVSTLFSPFVFSFRFCSHFFLHSFISFASFHFRLKAFFTELVHCIWSHQQKLFDASQCSQQHHQSDEKWRKKYDQNQKRKEMPKMKEDGKEADEKVKRKRRWKPNKSELSQWKKHEKKWQRHHSTFVVFVCIALSKSLMFYFETRHSIFVAFIFLSVRLLRSFALFVLPSSKRPFPFRSFLLFSFFHLFHIILFSILSFALAFYCSLYRHRAMFVCVQLCLLPVTFFSPCSFWVHFCRDFPATEIIIRNWNFRNAISRPLVVRALCFRSVVFNEMMQLLNLKTKVKNESTAAAAVIAFDVLDDWHWATQRSLIFASHFGN